MSVFGACVYHKDPKVAVGCDRSGYWPYRGATRDPAAKGPSAAPVNLCPVWR